MKKYLLIAPLILLFAAPVNAKDFTYENVADVLYDYGIEDIEGLEEALRTNSVIKNTYETSLYEINQALPCYKALINNNKDAWWLDEAIKNYDYYKSESTEIDNLLDRYNLEYVEDIEWLINGYEDNSDLYELAESYGYEKLEEALTFYEELSGEDLYSKQHIRLYKAPRSTEPVEKKSFWQKIKDLF